jgi:ribosome-associated protein
MYQGRAGLIVNFQKKPPKIPVDTRLFGGYRWLGGSSMDRNALREEIRAKAELSYSRSGGPGGQNVNKRDTKVTVRLAVYELESPGSEGLDRIRRRLSTRISVEGFLVIQAEGERSQARNREEALDRIENLIFYALRPDPKPRKKTRPSRASKDRRIKGKKIRSQIKSGRGRVSGHGDE